jgi:hypothetical protein
MAGSEEQKPNKIHIYPLCLTNAIQKMRPLSVWLFFYSWRAFLAPFPSQVIDFTMLIVGNAQNGSANELAFYVDIIGY